jgi:hypothetical protein
VGWGAPRARNDRVEIVVQVIDRIGENGFGRPRDSDYLWCRRVCFSLFASRSKGDPDRPRAIRISGMEDCFKFPIRLAARAIWGHPALTFSQPAVLVLAGQRAIVHT